MVVHVEQIENIVNDLSTYSGSNIPEKSSIKKVPFALPKFSVKKIPDLFIDEDHQYTEFFELIVKTTVANEDIIKNKIVNMKTNKTGGYTGIWSASETIQEAHDGTGRYSSEYVYDSLYALDAGGVWTINLNGLYDELWFSFNIDSETKSILTAVFKIQVVSGSNGEVYLKGVEDVNKEIILIGDITDTLTTSKATLYNGVPSGTLEIDVLDVIEEIMGVTDFENEHICLLTNIVSTGATALDFASLDITYTDSSYPFWIGVSQTNRKTIKNKDVELKFRVEGRWIPV